MLESNKVRVAINTLPGPVFRKLYDLLQYKFHITVALVTSCLHIAQISFSMTIREIDHRGAKFFMAM
jgi:hypothetical protein